MIKITPGPWRLVVPVDEIPYVEISKNPQRMIPTVEGRNFEEARANAKAIALVPEMIQAIEGLWDEDGEAVEIDYQAFREILDKLEATK